MNNKEFNNYIAPKSKLQQYSILKQKKPIARNVEYVPNMMMGAKNEIVPESRVYLPENVKADEIRRIYRKENINKIPFIKNSTTMKKSPFTRVPFNIKNVGYVFPKFNAKGELNAKFGAKGKNLLELYTEGVPIFEKIGLVIYIHERLPRAPISQIKEYLTRYSDGKIRGLVDLEVQGLNPRQLKVVAKTYKSGRDLFALLKLIKKQKEMGIPSVVEVNGYKRNVVDDLITFHTEESLKKFKQLLDSGVLSKEVIQAFAQSNGVLNKVNGLKEIKSAGLFRPIIVRAYLLFGRNVIPHLEKLKRIQDDSKKLSMYLKTIKSSIPNNNIEYIDAYVGNENSWKNMVRKKGYNKLYANELRIQYGKLPSSNMLDVMRHAVNYGKAFKKSMGIKKMKRTDDNTSSNEE